MQRSILGQLLPEAMVCFLENYGEWVGGWRGEGGEWEGGIGKKTFSNTIAL